MVTPPLYISACNGHTEVVKALLQNHAYVNQANNNGSTPLYCAALNGHTEVVKVLINAGADANVNHANKNSYTPLYCAALNGHRETVKVLINTGADASKTNNYGRKPLDFFHSWGWEEIIQATKKINKLKKKITSDNPFTRVSGCINLGEVLGSFLTYLDARSLSCVSRAPLIQLPMNWIKPLSSSQPTTLISGQYREEESNGATKKRRLRR